MKDFNKVNISLLFLLYLKIKSEAQFLTQKSLTGVVAVCS